MHDIPQTQPRTAARRAERRTERSTEPNFGCTPPPNRIRAINTIVNRGLNLSARGSAAVERPIAAAENHSINQLHAKQLNKPIRPLSTPLNVF
jgi:hypothetical protein